MNFATGDLGYYQAWTLPNDVATIIDGLEENQHCYLTNVFLHGYIASSLVNTDFIAPVRVQILMPPMIPNSTSSAQYIIAQTGPAQYQVPTWFYEGTTEGDISVGLFDETYVLASYDKNIGTPYYIVQTPDSLMDDQHVIRTSASMPVVRFASPTAATGGPDYIQINFTLEYDIVIVTADS